MIKLKLPCLWKQGTNHDYIQVTQDFMWNVIKLAKTGKYL